MLDERTDAHHAGPPGPSRSRPPPRRWQDTSARPVAGRLRLRRGRPRGRRRRCGPPGRLLDYLQRDAEGRRWSTSTGCCRYRERRARWRSTRRPGAAWRSPGRCATAAARARCWPCSTARSPPWARGCWPIGCANSADRRRARSTQRLDAVAELVGDAALGRRGADASCAACTTWSGCWPRVTTGRASPRDLSFRGPHARGACRRSRRSSSGRRSARLTQLEAAIDLCPELRAKLDAALADDCPLVEPRGRLHPRAATRRTRRAAAS